MNFPKKYPKITSNNKHYIPVVNNVYSLYNPNVAIHIIIYWKGEFFINV